MLIPLVPIKYRKPSGRLSKPRNVPAPPPATLVTSVQLISPLGVTRWTFDHPIETDGVVDPAMKLAGFEPVVFLQSGADWVELDYLQPIDPGAAWIIDQAPTHVTSPGREIVVPQNGTAVGP